MSKYKELSEKIIKNVGGRDNIDNVTHCLTRLRFKLIDESLVNRDELNNDSRIISTNYASGEFQVIVGNAVADIYDEVTSLAGNSKVKSSSNKNDGSPLNKFINIITKTITPTLGVLVSTGLLKGLLAFLTGFNLINMESGTYIILNGLGDTLFYFFPVILGYTSAEAFGLNKFIGMTLGATLMHPSIAAGLFGGEVIFEIFSGTPFAVEAYQTFLGVPVVFPAVGYTATVIPIILINYFASHVEKFFKKHIPDIVGFAFTPFLTLLIVAPLSFIVIGPIASMLSNFIGWATVALFDFSPIIASILVALIYQPLVIFGLHWPLITIAISNFTQLGYDFLWPTMFTASFAQTAVVLAVGLKTTNNKTKAMTPAALISGLMCIIEPAIYGFTLTDKKRFGFSMFGSAVGAVIITIFNAVQYSLGIGLFGFAGFINPNGSMRNVLIAAIATIVSMVIAFALTYITFTEVDDDTETDEIGVGEDLNIQLETNGEPIELLSPVKGKQISLDQIDDKAFRSEVLGKTIAIEPEEGVIYAPFDGSIISLAPTKHALGLVSSSGLEVLIHVGIDTVRLEGKYFNSLLKQGESFKKGQPLLEFDIEKIKEQGYPVETIITLTNTDIFSDVFKTNEEQLSIESNLMKVMV